MILVICFLKMNHSFDVFLVKVKLHNDYLYESCKSFSFMVLDPFFILSIKFPNVWQVPSQISQILTIRDKFVEISKQSDEKLTAMIEAAKDFRSGMEPLKKEVDQLQTRVKSMHTCTSYLEVLHMR